MTPKRKKTLQVRVKDGRGQTVLVEIDPPTDLFHLKGDVVIWRLP